MHLCWGNYEGPHHHDLPLADIIDLVLRARPAGLCLEAANPRHEHEWAVFQDVPLPDQRVIAGSDCGFASFAAAPLIDPRIAWAKLATLATLAEGARLASEMLWKNTKVEFP